MGSMCGIFTYIWLIFRVNVDEYTIHGSCGIYIYMHIYIYICDIFTFHHPIHIHFCPQEILGTIQSNSTKVKAWHVNMWKNIYLKFIPTRNSHPWSGYLGFGITKMAYDGCFFFPGDQVTTYFGELLLLLFSTEFSAALSDVTAEGLQLESRLGWRWIWQHLV